MALTTEQLAQAKALPGCNDITADNAAEKLLASAVAVQQAAQASNARITTLEADLASAKSAVPAQTPPGVLKAMATAARIHMKSAVDKQAITPAVAEALASAFIGTDDKLNPAGLTPDATGECVATKVFAALAGNGPAPEVGKDAGGQPVPKTATGAPDAKTPAQIMADAKAEGQAYQNAQRQQRGIPASA